MFGSCNSETESTNAFKESLSSVQVDSSWYLGVDGDNDGGMNCKLAAARLWVLLQQPIDEAQQLHHALLCTACIPEPDHQCVLTVDFALLLDGCLSQGLASHAAVNGSVREQSRHSI